MNYMDEEYNSRIGMNRGSTSWSSMSRGSREGMTRSPVDRDIMARVPRDREGIILGRIDHVARGQLDRNGLALDRIERDDVARGHMERDALARLHMDRDDIGRGRIGRNDMARDLNDMPHGLLDRGDVGQRRLDSGDMPWSHMDRDEMAWRRLDRDDKFRSRIERDDMLRPRDDLVRARLDRDNLPRARLDTDDLPPEFRDRDDLPRGHLDWGLLSRAILDRGGMAHGSLDREGGGRGPLDREGGGRGPLDREGGGRGPLDREGGGRGPLDREGGGRGPLDREGGGRGPLDREGGGRGPLDREGGGRGPLDREGGGRGPLDREGGGRGLLDREGGGRGPLDREGGGRGPLDREGGGRGPLDREGGGRGPLDREGGGRGPLDREGGGRGPLDREGGGRGPLDREGGGRGPLDREGGGRGPLDREGGGRGPLDREGGGRGPLDREGGGRGPLDREGGGRGPLDREGGGRGPLDREGGGRGPLDREGGGRGPLDREGGGRGPLDREGGGRGPLDREGGGRGPLEREGMLTVGKTKDQMGKGDAIREATSGSKNKENPQGRVDRDNGGQSDMEISDVEVSDVEHSDMELSDVEPSDIKQGSVGQSQMNKGDVLDVNSADPKKEDASKDDNPEDDKKKYYCEICRLTCLSSMSYQSHIRGQKHMKATRAAENSGFSVMTKAKKKMKIEKTLKDYMDEPIREPLIGLEHVLEYRLPGKVEPSYHCELCDFKTELAPIIEHLNGFKHRKAYISKEFPFLLKAPPGQKEDKVQFLRRMAADIERDEGLKMYRVDVLTKKKKLKSLLEIKPDEIDIKRSRWDNLVPNNEALKTKALLCLETYEIDSDTEAVLIMTITQDLTQNLKTYCLKVKEETEQAEKVARARSVAEALSQTNPAMQQGPQETFGTGSFPPGGGNWNLLPNQQTPYGAENKNWQLDPIHHNQQTQFSTGGPNWNRDTMQNQAPSGRGNWNRESIMPNTLRPMEEFGRDPMKQAMNTTNAQGLSASFGRPDPFGPKGLGSELRPFPLNESRGPGGFPSGNRGFGNEFSLPDRGPIAGSMSLGPPSLLNQPSSLLRNNPLTPGISRLVDVPKGEPVEKFIRGLQNQGAAFNLASSGGFLSGTQAKFNAGSNMMPENFSAEGRIGNVGYSQFLPLNADRLPLGRPSAALDMPRAVVPEKKASPLTAEILTRIRGKDVKSASVILTSLATSNPALQKVNIANLLNLLVETGTIK